MTLLDEVRVFEISSNGISAASLRFRDLLDIAEVTGLDVMQLSPILEGRVGTGADRLRALAAFTWIIYRRNEPELTFDDVLDGTVKVRSDPVPLGSQASPMQP